jgi:hypothetical protein
MAEVTTADIISTGIASGTAVVDSMAEADSTGADVGADMGAAVIKPGKIQDIPMLIVHALPLIIPALVLIGATFAFGKN